MFVILPPARHASLRAFWFAGALLAGLTTGALVALVRHRDQALVAGLLGAALAAAPGLAWPEAVRPAYRAWNRLARVYARLARRALLAVAYYGIVTPVGRVGASLDLEDPRHSMWRPASQMAPDASQSQLGDGSGGGWIGPLARWGCRSRHPWWLALLPLLALLAAVEPEEPASSSGPAADLYTLF
jgi:hypothetical protein